MYPIGWFKSPPEQPLSYNVSVEIFDRTYHFTTFKKKHGSSVKAVCCVTLDGTYKGGEGVINTIDHGIQKGRVRGKQINTSLKIPHELVSCALVKSVSS